MSKPSEPDWAAALPGPEREAVRGRQQLAGLVLAGLRSALNSCWRSGPGPRLASLLAVPLLGLLWLATIPELHHLLRGVMMGSPAHLLSDVSVLVAVLAAFTLTSSVSFAMASLYLAEDIPWLLTSPISARLLLTQRLLSQLTLGICVGGALGGPVLLAAAGLRGGPALVPLVLVALVALLAMPMAVALLLVVLLVRLLPGRAVKDVAALLVGLAGFGIAAANLAAAATGSGGLRVGGLSAAAGAPAWLPTGWAARAITDAAEGSWGSAMLLVAAVLGAALVVVPGALLLAGPRLRDGWVRSQVATSRTRTRRVGRRRLPPMLALARKDWRTLRRDPSQLIQLLLPAGLFAVYLLSPERDGLGGRSFHDFPIWYGPLTTASFAALFVASGLGLRALGSEGKQLWCLRSAPLGPGRVVLGKLLLPALIATAASLVLMVSAEFSQGAGPAPIALSALLLVMLVWGLASLATGMGAVWPRLDWSDPRRAVRIWLAVAFLVVGASYLGISLVALTLPLVLLAGSGALAYLVSVLACLACSGGAALLALSAGRRRLALLDR